MTHVHLIGIGGTGLSAIARLLIERGFFVSGSDQASNPRLVELERAGAIIYRGHHADNIRGANIIVRSSAVLDDNPEVAAAHSRGIPVYKRSDFLGRLMGGTTGIAIAGTHGKTTTTAMIAWILKDSGLDPSYIIGSTSHNLGANAHSGSGPFVIEADEYDYMFLGLEPQIEVLTTVEYDHADCFPTVQEYREAFARFIERMQPGGTLVACIDDPISILLARGITPDQHLVTYGLSPTADYSAGALQNHPGSGYSFDVLKGGRKIAHVDLQVPGIHNVRNSLGALAASALVKVTPDQAVKSLSAFTGASRRFEIIGESHGVVLISDYAHHPTEIRTTLAAARARHPHQRIWVVWQPHTFSRTKSLLNEFANSFSDADCVIITAIYAARDSDPYFSAQQVVDNMDHPSAVYIPDMDDVTSHLFTSVRSGDVVLVLSAGDADRILPALLQQLEGKD